jgi:Flp pilus assembly protein TadG
LSWFPRIRKCGNDRRGSVAVEFAIVVGILFSVIFAVLQLGLLFWTRSTLQMTASMTARCVAIGTCTTSTAKAYAQTLAGTMAAGNILADGTVTVSQASNCYASSTAFTGYTLVKISTPFWSNVLVGPIPGTTLTVSACYANPA